MNAPNPASALDPDVLHYLPIGIGNAFTRHHFNASLLLFAGGRTILVDAPAPLRHVLGAAEATSGLALDLDTIDEVFLTHLHGDHCNGLEELGFWRMFIGGGRRPVLRVHEDMAHDLWHHRLRAAMGVLDEPAEVTLETYFDVRPYRAGQAVDLMPGGGGLVLEPRMTTHMVPCAGFRVSWRGRSLGYSADTGFDPTLIDFLGDCDCIIHETGYGRGHTPLEDLVALPAAVRDRMRLIHLPDDFDPAACPIPALEQGRLYRV